MAVSSIEAMATLAPLVVFTVFEVRAFPLKLMKHKWRELFVVFALNGTILDNDGANLWSKMISYPPQFYEVSFSKMSASEHLTSPAPISYSLPN